MFLSDNEMNVEVLKSRHEDMRCQVENNRLVREARKARRDETSSDTHNTVRFVQRLFALFF